MHRFYSISVPFFSFLFVSTMAVGDGGSDNKSERFQKAKQERLQELDQQLNILQTFRNCLSAASDGAAIGRCHQAREQQMKDLRAKYEEKRKQNIDDQIGRLEEAKSKIGRPRS